MIDRRDRILIVGAGPTGLTLALCLEAYNVPFDIIEAKDGPCRDSKALAMNPWSLDQLELFGVRSQIGAGGRRVRRLNISYDGMRLSPVDLRWLDHDRNYFVAQPQHATERDLIAELEKRDVRIAFRTELLSIQPSEESEDDRPDHARSAIRTADGKIEIRDYRYIVGCDGKRSRVRSALGIEMAGTEYPMHLVLGDFELDAELDPDQAHYFIYDDTFFVFVPHSPGIWRVVVKHDGAPETSPAGPEAITEPVRRHFGRDPFKSTPVWFSKAPLYLKIASRLSSGAALLAGDSAHLFSPIGGTGMNTGMQDALNLGWKLAASMLGIARDGRLLASYEHERLQAINANAAITNMVTRLIARLERSPERIAPFLPRLANRRALARITPAAQAGLALKYVGSPALASAVSASHAPLIGTVCRRLPALVRRAHGGFATQPSWYVLASPADDHDAAKLDGACLALSAHARLLSAGDAAGVESGDIQLVRPDGIVYFAGKIADADSMVRQVSSLLVSGERAQESEAC